MRSAAFDLKSLRQRARPPLTLRSMAEKVGMPASSYARYEDPNDFKKPYLSMDFARRVAAVLADHGIDQADVMRLAGIDEATTPELSAGEEQLLDRFRHLDADQRRLLLQLADAIGRDAPAAASAHSGAKEHA